MVCFKLSLFVLWVAFAAVVFVPNSQELLARTIFKGVLQAFIYLTPIDDPSGLGASREMRATEAFLRGNKLPANTFQELHEGMEGFTVSQPGREDVQKETILVPNLKDTETTFVPCVWCVPSNAEKDRVILYFHGGGMCAGHPRHEYGVSDELAIRAKAAIFSVDYRFIQNASVELAVSDGVAAYRYLLQSKQYQPDQVIFWGCSGGGMAALLTALQVSISQELPNPSAVLAASPGLGFELLLPDPHKFPELPSWVRDRNTDCDALIDETNVVHAMVDVWIENKPYWSSLVNNASFLGPTYIYSGEKEALHVSTMMAYEHLHQQNSKVKLMKGPNQGHCYMLFHNLFPEASKLLDDLLAWAKPEWKSN